MEHLRQGIGLRGYAQKNPKQEYKREAFILFTELLVKIKQEIASLLMRAEFIAQESVQALEQERREALNSKMILNHNEIDALAPNEAQKIHNEHTPLQSDKKVGRNEPCPCGSGKKYKQCHGKL
jgi:preprotein translocase subunit SecA